jgi:sn-glycerol 3-phosphate transport system substrate-binding protein
MPRLSTTVLTLALSGAVLPVQAATEITWWHAMNQDLGRKVDEIAADFNASQDEYVIKPEYRGNYNDTMTAAIAAYRAGKAPDIVQIFEVGTATMMSAKGAIVPVYQLMQEHGTDFDPSVYLPAVTGYYTDTEGNMLSLPFNSSTPVLYVNRDELDAAGVDEIPRTWQEMDTALTKLVDSGATQCGMTATWLSWTQMENFSALHDIPFASEENGFAGLDTRLQFNHTAVVDHLKRLAEWQKDGRFRYGGRFSDALPLFYSGECAMVFASSASLAGIRSNAKDFDFAVAPMPYDAELVDKPHNSIIGGASLWVMNGKSDEVYDGIAKFFQYLSSPEVQADWHQFSGYLPITEAAHELTKQQGYYDEHPKSEVAIKQLTASQPTSNSKGLRLGNMSQIRNIIYEEMENVFNGQQSVQQALDRAVERGNELLARFQQANQR